MSEEQDVKVKHLDEEEAKQAFDEDERSALGRMDEAMDPEAAATERPEWAIMPEGIKYPEEGTQIAFFRIPAHWTRTPARGDRMCACWPITETEERLAYTRARGDGVRAISELTKATIRVVDGAKTDWSGNMKTQGSIVAFWSDIGPKGRAMIRNWYIKTHNVSDEEALDFFSNHFVNVTVARG